MVFQEQSQLTAEYRGLLTSLRVVGSVRDVFNPHKGAWSTQENSDSSFLRCSFAMGEQLLTATYIISISLQYRTYFGSASYYYYYFYLSCKVTSANL